MGRFHGFRRRARARPIHSTAHCGPYGPLPLPVHQTLAHALRGKSQDRYAPTDRRSVWGGTVFRGIAGFGARGLVHSADLLWIAADLPLVSEASINLGTVDTVIPPPTGTATVASLRERCTLSVTLHPVASTHCRWCSGKSRGMPCGDYRTLRGHMSHSSQSRALEVLRRTGALKAGMRLRHPVPALFLRGRTWAYGSGATTWKIAVRGSLRRLGAACDLAPAALRLRSRTLLNRCTPSSLPHLEAIPHEP